MLTLMLAVFLVISFAGTVPALQSTTNITLERLSNPQAGPGEPDGIKPWGTDDPAYPFRGDRWNSYIWSMACFTPKNACCEEGESALYVGTNRNVLYSMFLELYLNYLADQFTIEEFDWIVNKLFCGNIPTGFTNNGDCIDKDFRAQIWKWPLCNGPWEQVYSSTEDDYDCCGPYYDYEGILNSEHPLCCTSKWKLGPDWGYRGVSVYTPKDNECFDGGGGEICCSWPRIIFGGSRSFAGLGGFDTGIPPIEHLRAIGFGHPGDGYFPEEVFCDPNQNGSLRAITTYKACACEDPECCELPSYDHLIIGSESNLYMTNDLRGYTEIACSAEDFLGGDIFDALQYGNYLYVVASTYEGSGFSLWRGKPGNVCADSITPSTCPDDDDCPGIEGSCPWEWEALVACKDGELYEGARYPSGFGITNHGAASLAICDGCLYIGAFNMSVMTSFAGLLDSGATSDIESALKSQNINQSTLNLLASDETAPVSFVTEPLRANCLFNFLGGAMHSLLSTFMETDKIQGTRVYRFCSSECGGTEKWDLVAGAPNICFPGGSISNIQGDGFSEDPLSPTKWNVYTWRMVCCNNKLYATTYDVTANLDALTECWCQENGTIGTILDCLDVPLKEKLCCILDLLKKSFAEENNNNPTGFDMYRLENPEASSGLQWTMITQDGFGDKYNYGGRTLECCECDGQDCIFVGTANPFWGGQVWKICPECIPEDVVESGSFCPCGTWELTLTPCECGEVSGDILLTSNPERFLEGDSNIYFQIATTGEVCGIELCVDFSDCSTCSGYDALAHWDGSQWNDLGDPSSGELCVNVTAFPDDVFAVGTGFAFPGDDDDDNGTPGDDDDDASGTPGPSTGGSGCNVGTGAAVLLLLLPIGALWLKKF